MTRLGEPRRVAVLRALQLGDFLCATPAFRALRTALPMAEVVLLGLPWARICTSRYRHLFDGYREFPGYPGLPERPPQLHAIPPFLTVLQAESFDLVVQMQGSGTITNPLVGLFGARQQAGYYLPGQFCPDPERFCPYPDSGPEVRRHLRLMEFLGVPLGGEELEFPLHEADYQALKQEPSVGDLRPGSYVCLHPGARARVRRWPVEHFAAVGDALAAAGWPVVITGSPLEAELTAAVAAAMKRPARDLAGPADLGCLAALLSRARLVICNNTGVSHLAAAVRTPSVVLFHNEEEVRRWAPLDTRRHRSLLEEPVVRPQTVLEQAEDLLREDFR